jgi:intracellular multiplication protein IcmP
MAPPQPGGRQSWASQDDYAGFNLIVIVLGSCIFGYLLWITDHAQISAFVMAIIHYEIGLISKFTDRYNFADQEMTATDPSSVRLKDLYEIAQAVGMFFRIPATVIIVLLAAICSVRAAPTRFKRSFDLDWLIKELAQSFPVISAFSQRHLKLIAPAQEPLLPADYALTPAEWIERYASNGQGANGQTYFNEQKARTALGSQLGERWKRAEDASPAGRLIFAAFALHLAERRDDAVEILGLASACVADTKQDGENGPLIALQISSDLIAQVDGFLRDEKEMSVIKAARMIAGQHAFEATALMALLTAARIRAGVMAPAQFLWLKLVDRNLLYALHSLGYDIEGVGRYIHPNPRIEALGARNHWAAERVVGRPILKPYLDEALGTLRRFVDAREAGRDV